MNYIVVFINTSGDLIKMIITNRANRNYHENYLIKKPNDNDVDNFKTSLIKSNNIENKITSSVEIYDLKKTNNLFSIAEVTHNKNGNAEINIPIKFTGDGASKRNIDSIKKNIASTWSGDYVVDGKVKKVTVNVIDSTIKNKNSIELKNGPTDLKGGESYVKGSKEGQWNVKDIGIVYSNVAAHEAGHLMGEPDRYSPIYNNKGKRTKTIPHKGYENSLMGKVGFDIKPSNQTMTNILNNTKNTHVYEK
jgi:hypothetical protein